MKYVVMWTWRKHRLVNTKKEGQRLLKVWKKWYKRKGWDVSGQADNGFVALPPYVTEWEVLADRMLTAEGEEPTVVRSIGLRKAEDYGF